MTNEKIGFIGVGFMGHGMAKNIVEKGYPLTVIGHRNRAPIEDLVTRGAKEAKSVKALAEAINHRLSMRDRVQGGGSRVART